MSWFIVGLTHFVASENMIDDVSDFVNVRNVLNLTCKIIAI
jgi:hypothetical protein